MQPQAQAPNTPDSPTRASGSSHPHRTLGLFFRCSQERHGRGAGSWGGMLAAVRVRGVFRANHASEHDAPGGRGM